MAALWSLVLILAGFLFQCQGHEGREAVIKEVSQASNTFGINLYRTKTIGEERKNTFFSGLSIFTALAMVNAGARGDTSYQLQKVLNWHLLAHPNDELKPDEKVARFLRAALDASSSSPLRFANKLWLQKYFCTSLCKTYAKKLMDNFDTDLGEVDFAFSTEKARQSINKWVSDETAGKIKELMEAGSVTGLTRLVLTNAIYFKGNWKYKFDKAFTFKDDFYVSPKKTVKVDYMTIRRKMMFTQDDDNMVLEIPFAAPNLSMIVLLPRDRYGIGNLEHTFSDSVLRSYFRSLKEEKVSLYFPKFTLDSDVKLKDFLTQMGVTHLFDPSTADLSGVTGYAGLYVTHAIHKAHIVVNEDGSEAAAATGIGASFRSIDPDLYILSADHPFLFAIIHRPTVTILFNGEVVDPTMKMPSA